jgi:hypothetical protein
MRTSIAVLALAIAWPAGLVAQEAGDSAGITQAALDYIEGWYEGNADRMTRALHPDLVKRIVADRGGSSHIQGMTAEQLIGYTAGGGGRNTPEEKRRTEVRIKVDGEWKILNVLWEFRPEVKAKMMERQKQAED